ncbi:MAG: MBL fold metallo-hydrolase [Promethearchaeota archaeon]
MFEAKTLAGYEDIFVIKTCTSFLRRPLMWTFFLLIDNVFLDTGNTNCSKSQFTRFLEEKVPERNCVILNTHLHEDHCGNNHFIQQKLDARIYAPKKRANFDDVTLFFRIYWGTPQKFEHHVLNQQEIETVRGKRLKVIPSPGHTPCHVVYYLKDQDILFTGDAIPLAVSKKYSMPEEDYLQTISTLERLLNIINSNTTVICGHRGILRNPREYIQVRIENMKNNAQMVTELWESGLEDISKLGKTVFGRQGILYRLISARFGLDNTVRSIIPKEDI